VDVPDEVKWKGKPWRLTRSSVTKWQQNPFWEKVTGYPTEFCTDYTSNYLTLNYRTSTTDVLMLTVRRMPIVDLVADTDVPEIRTHYHDFMINGILWQMYSKQDADSVDKVKAEEYRTAYLRDLDEIKQQETILDQRLKPNYAMPAFL
jgi:hypothetical protein